jgi:hypothetical protein
VEVVSDVLEEGIEVLFYDLELAADEVTPLNGHVVECNIHVVKFRQSFRLGYSVQHLS